VLLRVAWFDAFERPVAALASLNTDTVSAAPRLIAVRPDGACERAWLLWLAPPSTDAFERPVAALLSLSTDAVSTGSRLITVRSDEAFERGCWLWREPGFRDRNDSCARALDIALRVLCLDSCTLCATDGVTDGPLNDMSLRSLLLRLILLTAFTPISWLLLRKH
jgi:hypothetical protein